jgi:predicted PP-loop superfamily ATPase
MTQMTRCKICCLSSNFPGAQMDEHGICKECRKFEQNGDPDLQIRRNHANIDAAILERRGKGRYDVIVAYSGGKDSSFSLLYLKETYDLKVLAFLVDNNFVSEQAKKNADAFTGKLGVDLVTFKPNSRFMNKMYTTSLEGDLYDMSQLSRANAACLSCINLINNFVLDEAVRRKVPIIAGGYIEGQIPNHSGVVKMDNPMIHSFRDKNRKKLSTEIDPRFDSYLNIASPQDEDEHPIFINPLLGMNYSEAEIIETISRYDWTRPTDTGKSSSNCLLNDYAISVHHGRYGFHPYEAEICAQVRRGSLTKEEALEKLEDVRPADQFAETKRRLADQ